MRNRSTHGAKECEHQLYSSPRKGKWSETPGFCNALGNYREDDKWEEKMGRWGSVCQPAPFT
eukprot:12821930-Prorocentrum_lima.AAC.1